MATITKEEALRYHEQGKPGKIEVIPTKPYSTQYDLSLAYTPGVAEPCLEIEKNQEDAYRYTSKGNLVAVISNGTAVLGLGDIGALAGKPVMEGKGLLFKVFADVDVFDIEVNEKDPKKFIEIVKGIAPTFGGINLEDIKSPECFEIEQTLIKELNIPVMHDDQHGTAIISGAGLLNALELADKKIGDVKVVVNGAGAAGIMCARYYVSLGVNLKNVWMLDSKGLLATKRTDLNEEKKQFSQNSDLITLEEVIAGADVFLGLSKGNIMSKKMVQSMANDPIVFAMANPTPEISYEDAMDARKDIIMATGRSDYPNQINNVLGFPYIFRGALDVRATVINEEMKKAATYALAELAKKEVPEKVNAAYNSKNLTFGRDYIIPKPLDPRLITEVAPAVARAAMETGVAKNPIKDWDAYRIKLMKQMGIYNKLTDTIITKAKQQLKRIVISDAENYNVIKAVQMIKEQGIAEPILIGNRAKILANIQENCPLGCDTPIIDFNEDIEADRLERYAQMIFVKRQRKGCNLAEARQMVRNIHYFGVMMVEAGDADGFLAGFSTKYSDTIRPALQICGTNNSLNHIAGMYVVMNKKGTFFFADTTVNHTPNTKTLIDTTLLTVNEVRRFNMEPVVALVSYSNFGSTRTGSPKEVRDAVSYLHKEYPELIVDGEMQANYAFNKQIRMEKFPFSKLGNKDVNTIIFPNLSSGNIAYKMMMEITDAEIIGPILLGVKRPINVLQMGASIREIVNMAAITAIGAQTYTDEIMKL
ncbi:MAG: NADP-dependent malic enzyme [Salinivirgaceae bacterium]|nr:NADP-dependent malic enzyme [Salinivirgaceae bacterium]